MGGPRRKKLLKVICFVLKRYNPDATCRAIRGPHICMLYLVLYDGMHYEVVNCAGKWRCRGGEESEDTTILRFKLGDHSEIRWTESDY